MLSPSHPQPGFLRPSWRQQTVNVILCLLLAFLVFGYIRRHVFIFPVTMETIWQIGLAETNRRKSKRRVQQLSEELNSSDVEKRGAEQANYPRCLASVVGYREEPNLFTKCLESYRNCPGLEAMLVGIDGNEPQDMEMANIVRKVGLLFHTSAFVHIRPGLDLYQCRSSLKRSCS